MPCQHCQDSGWIEGPDGRYTRCQACLARVRLARLRSLDLFGDDGPPEARYKNAAEIKMDADVLGVGTPTQRRELFQTARKVFSWAQKPKGWILVYGQVGSYKTAMMAMAHKMIPDSVYIYCPILVQQIFRCIDRNEDLKLWNLLDDYAAVPVLLVDDFGAEYSNGRSEFAISQLTDLFDRRYQRVKPTLVATNLTPTRLSSEEKYRRLGDRLLDVHIGQQLSTGIPSTRRLNA